MRRIISLTALLLSLAPAALSMGQGCRQEEVIEFDPFDQASVTALADADVRSMRATGLFCGDFLMPLFEDTVHCSLTAAGLSSACSIDAAQASIPPICENEDASAEGLAASFITTSASAANDEVRVSFDGSCTLFGEAVDAGPEFPPGCIDHDFSQVDPKTFIGGVGGVPFTVPAGCDVKAKLDASIADVVCPDVRVLSQGSITWSLELDDGSGVIISEGGLEMGDTDYESPWVLIAPGDYFLAVSASWVYDGSVVARCGHTEQASCVQLNPTGEVGISFEWACFADLDCDGTVGQSDLVILLSSYGPCPSGCPADLDCDRDVDFDDQLILMSNWGPCPAI